MTRERVVAVTEGAAGWDNPPEPNPSDIGVIWSREHEGWWRPFGRGYTRYLHEAGLYSRRAFDEGPGAFQTEGEENDFHLVRSMTRGSPNGRALGESVAFNHVCISY